MLDPGQLREHVVAPVLRRLNLFSISAVELMMGTAYQESRLVYIHQLGGGPARGLWQMEPATHDDIWANYLNFNPGLSSKVLRYACQFRVAPQAGDPDAHDEMEGNLYYACAMARVHYLRVPIELPPAGDVHGMARYWKRYYNTPMGKGTEAEYRAGWAEIKPLLP